jgi:organic hydroperoxide reductase OsmC/OhrA
MTPRLRVFIRTGLNTDGQLELTLPVPREMDGGGRGTNPEELFAVG